MTDFEKMCELRQKWEDERNEKLELRQQVTDAEDEIRRLKEKLIKNQR